MDMRSNNHQQQQQQVLDGSDIVELVENEKVFDKFVEQKFQQLDQDEDGKLSVTELQPAVADIGAALGLPAQGTSPDSDHIYSEVNFFFDKYMNFIKTISSFFVYKVLIFVTYGPANLLIILYFYSTKLFFFLGRLLLKCYIL